MFNVKVSRMVHSIRMVDVTQAVNFDQNQCLVPMQDFHPSPISSYVRVKLGSSLYTFRRRWAVDLYWRSFFKTDDDEPRFSWTELEFHRSPTGRGMI